MKVSTITCDDIANYIRLQEVDEADKKLLNALITIAKKFITENTGVKDLDEYDDFIIVVFILQKKLTCNYIFRQKSSYIHIIYK